MFRVRVISAAVGIVVLTAVMLLGPEVMGVAISIMAAIGMHEFYNAVSGAGYRPVRIVGYIYCIPLLVIALGGNSTWFVDCFNPSTFVNYFFLSFFLILLILFSLIIFQHKKYNVVDIALTIFGPAYVVLLFSFVILTRYLDHGILFIWLIFIGAWGTDTFAYFTGRFLGKRKVLPVISPKKTLEGVAGGVIGTLITTVVFGILVINSDFDYNIPAYHFIILGTLNGIISQIGDWGASAIKRYVNIKDYGNIMPGHGGILDRFDSILFIAPVVYFYYTLVLK